jgi:hypothetical protein
MYQGINPVRAALVRSAAILTRASPVYISRMATRLVVGTTGHRLLEAETARLVERALYERLAGLAAHALIGVSSLAEGADQLFAEVILALGGSLEVVLPAERYRDELPAASQAAYDRLLAQASEVHCLTYDDLTDDSYMAAGRAMVHRSDLVLAVWDGRDARGLGGTGDVVAYARERGVPVEVVWPDGALRP